MSNQPKDDITDFGFTKVPYKKKQAMVQGVFTSVSQEYDLMNNLMSFGLHKLWKMALIRELYAPNSTLLDVAGGTGDIAHEFIKAGGKRAVVCDLNKEMMEYGSQHKPNKLIDWKCGDAQSLPIDDCSFDYCTISFGIRNVTNIKKALMEMYRILNYGGKFACLEFSNVNNAIIEKIYELYSFNIIPKIGQVIAGDIKAYKYLVESIAMFPCAEEFKSMIESAGFENVKYKKLTFGVVAIHFGYKI